MEEYLKRCQLLGTIDIPFLKKVSAADVWDSLFYELFKLLMDVDSKEEELFIYYRNHLLFFKKKNEKKIEIRKLNSPLSESFEEEYLIVVNNAEKYEQSILVFEILKFLAKRNIHFELLSNKPKHLKNLVAGDSLSIVHLKRE